jgi:hypothetical protein
MYLRMMRAEQAYRRANADYMRTAERVAELEEECERLGRELIVARGAKPNGGGMDA